MSVSKKGVSKKGDINLEFVGMSSDRYFPDLKVLSKFAHLFVFSVLLFSSGTQAEPLYPLRINVDNRYLEDQAGEPFFINGDTPWSLIVGLTKAEAELYLEDRRSRGFNAVIVELIEHSFGGPANRDGDLPFVSGGEFTQPNEEYFLHADWVIRKAAEKGIAVILTPAYLGYNCGSQGWCQEMKSVSLANLKSYGNFLGNRYRDFDNIIWLHGGDADASLHGADDEVNAIAQGILESDPTKLISAHCSRQNSAIDCYDEPWLHVNNTYSNCGQSAAKTKLDYQRSPDYPFFYSEGAYEGEGTSLTCLRSQAYWSALGGSTGHFFGNNPIWLFDPGWEQALDSDGSQSMTHYGALFASRPWQDLVPDYSESFVSGDRGTVDETDYVAAARTSDGNVIIAYMPAKRTITVDLSSVSGSLARAWWFDPSTGSAQEIGDFQTTGNQSFTPPSGGDWVLVVDNADLGFGAPGSSGSPPPGDTTPPTLIGATAFASPNEVLVSFSEAIEESSAETANNYSIDQGVIVSAAELQANQTSVVLTTTDLSESIEYTLTVNNIRDRASSPNLIAANSQVRFDFDAGPGGGGPDNYVWDALSVGTLAYIDSGLVVQSVPAGIVGAQFLRTANADSMASGMPFLTVDLAEPSTVFVAYDERNSTLPAWLQSWQMTSDEIAIGVDLASAKETSLILYSQDFAAGSAALGGNEMGNNMYIVIVQESAPIVPQPPRESGGSGLFNPLWIMVFLLVKWLIQLTMQRPAEGTSS